LPHAQSLRYFNSSPEIIRLTVMMYIRYPLSRRQVEDLLFDRGIDICHETVRFWWNRFGPRFAAEIRRRRAESLRALPQWRWHLDEVFVRINGEMHYLWRAVDHEGEVLEVFATKRRDRKAAPGVPEARDEALRQASGHCDRPSALLRGSNERYRRRATPSVRSLAQ
jgi:transposase-like protein